MKSLINQRGDIETVAVLTFWGLLILAAVSIPIIRQTTHHTETLTVERTERVAEANSSRYLIWTDKGVYENTDELLQWKFNSSDLYGQLKAGKSYECDMVGWRVPFLSWYPNLISCDEVK